jgi:hypothetical protein
MTKEDFDNLLVHAGYGNHVVIWDDINAYFITGVSREDKIVYLQSNDHFSYEAINESNYESFHYKLTGEMKAILALAVRDSVREIFNNI